MEHAATPRLPMPLGQAQAIVEYVENPHNPVGVGFLTWARYYRARMTLLRSDLPLQEKIRYTHLHGHPRALNAVELEQYIGREIEYMGERLAYLEQKLQQLWQAAGVSARQWETIREGLELPFTYRELTQMWEQGA